MSITTTSTKDSYTGNNSTSTPYPITFKYLEDSHITVYVDGVALSNSYYTLTGDGSLGTGQFTTALAYAGTQKVVVVLDVPFDQPVELLETGVLSSSTLEEAYDRLNMQIRRVWRKAQSVLTFSTDEGGAGSTGTADNLLGFDDTGNLTEIPNTTFLQTANDLSDVDAATARTNLGVDASGTRFALSELTDSTITTPSSGELLSWNGSAWTNTGTDAVGGMLEAVYDPTTVSGDAFDSANHAYTPAGTGAVDTTVETKLRESVSVADFGAVGDGVADDTAAIQAAIDYLLSNTETKKLSFSSKHRVTAPLNCTGSGGKRYELLGGDGIASTEIVCDFNGYGQSLFQFGDDASPAYQTSVNINGFLITKGAGSDYQPIGINGASLAQSRINNITFGSWNNTCISLNTPQNCRGSHLTTFGGGVSFEYKDASAVTVTQSGTTLTASGSVFSASDVGKTVALWGTGASTYRRKAKISAYTSATQVTVNTNVTDATAREIYFGSPFGSITASATTFVADSPCFTANHVGLVLWIKGAGANGGLHRAEIASYTSSTTVELDVAAITTVSASEFGVATMEIYSDSAISNGASDNRFDGIQIEDHNGVGLCVYDSDILEIEGKIHGEQSATSDDYSISAIWADRWGGRFQGAWDAQYIGEDRSWFGNNTASLHIPSLTTRTAYNETVIRVGDRNAAFEGAQIVIGHMDISGDDSTDNLRGQIFIDSNTPIDGYTINGTVTRSAYDLTRHFAGRDVYSNDVGAMSVGSISFDNLGNNLNAYTEATTFTPEIADSATGGNVASGTFAGTYERVGNMILVSIDLRSIDTTGMTAGNNLYIRNLPIPIRGGANNRFVGQVRADNVSFTGYIAPYADNNDDYFLLYDVRSGQSSLTTKVSDLSSGTANLFVTVTYLAGSV